MVADDSTDNATAFAAINAAAAALATTTNVNVILSPGIYRLSTRPVLDGNVSYDGFGQVQFSATGTDDTQPFITHGVAGTRTYGHFHGIKLKSLVSNHYYLNPNWIGYRAICKYNFKDWIPKCENFTTAVQYLAITQNCGFGTLRFGEFTTCKFGVEVVTGSADSAFSSQIVVDGAGDFETTTSLNDFGMCAAVVMSRWYDSGYTGNVITWNGGSIQITGTATPWSASLNVTAYKKLFSSRLGAEWMIGPTTLGDAPGTAAGQTGSTEPTVIPSGSNVVSLTSIVLTQGSAQIQVSSSTGLAVGDLIQGTNPLNAFPENTFILTVDDSTHVTLTKPAAASSTTYKATFIKPTTDGTAKLYYRGPYRRPALWLRDAGANVVIDNARLEGGYGEQEVRTGAYRFPETGCNAAASSIRGHSAAATAVNICREPPWTAGEVMAVGMRRRRAVLGSTPYIWEVIATSSDAKTDASTEPTPTEAENLVFVDNHVTWICRRAQTTAFSDRGIYTAGIHTFKGRISTPFYDTSPSVACDNLHELAVGSASGWRIPGWSRHANGGVSASEFSLADFEMHERGLILLSSSEFPGRFIRCDKQKAFRVRKMFKDGYAASRMYVNCLGANGERLASNADQTYHQRVHGPIGIGSGTGTWNEQADNVAETIDLFFSDEVKSFTLSWSKGSTPCVFDGFHISALGFKADSSGLIDSAPTVYNPYSPSMIRDTLAIPSRGSFLKPFEFLPNANPTISSGNPKGWWVTTVGRKALTWTTGIAVVRGQWVELSGGGVYVSLGRFTTGTTPSGTSTSTPVVDGTAASVLDGSPYWLYKGPSAAFTVENFP